MDRASLIEFTSPACGKTWGLSNTDGPFSFAAEERGEVKMFTHQPLPWTGSGWELIEVYTGPAIVSTYPKRVDFPSYLSPLPAFGFNPALPAGPYERMDR